MKDKEESENMEKFGLEKDKIIESIIAAAGKVEEYLKPEIIKKFRLLDKCDQMDLIIKGEIEKNKKTDSDLKFYDYFDLVNLMFEKGYMDKYFMPGQNIEKDYLDINNLFYIKHKSEFLDKLLYNLYKRNKSLYEKINMEFIVSFEIDKIFNEEQLIRITNYPEVQEYFLRNNNRIMIECLKYLMSKDKNWIISLDKIIKYENQYKTLLQNLYIDDKEIIESFIENFLSIISESENYFNIQSYKDVINYSSIKQEICLNILNGNKENIPETLKKYSESDLYKFAFLEYKFGIDLVEAQRLIERYGADSDQLPKNDVSEYIRILKSIMECYNIKDIVNYAIKNDLLESPWIGFPNARSAEGTILNMFEELYNETLYRPKEQDKLDSQEIYVDESNTEHKIDVYVIKDDFNMNVRVEGAFHYLGEQDSYIEFYENPNLENHGNCGCYIGNSLIATPPIGEGIRVGYDYIYQNTLTAVGPYDLFTSNKEFSIFNEYAEFRIPQEMQNHTREPYNEMVEERLIIDKNGNVVKCKPSYIVWIEEDLKSERNELKWKKNREENENWIMTKKAASQLGIPIIVIDREYFAERENAKIDVMKKIITGKNLCTDEFKEFTKQYNKLSKSELIKQLIIKFENNRTGIQLNCKLNRNIFYTGSVTRFNAGNKYSNRSNARRRENGMFKSL